MNTHTIIDYDTYQEMIKIKEYKDALEHSYVTDIKTKESEIERMKRENMDAELIINKLIEVIYKESFINRLFIAIRILTRT